jgi:hypothetical protein
MKRIFFSVVILFAIVQLISCGSSDQEVVMHVHDATLKVRVYKEADGGGGNIIQVDIPGATVEVYKSESDRELSLNEVIEHTTDSSGATTFVGLKEDYYYLRCVHPNYSTKLDEVSTPDGTISFVDFVY